jgi:hypothetical protein
MNINREKSFWFWQKWLLYSSLIFAFTGVLMALYGKMFTPYLKLLAGIFWMQSFIPEQSDSFRAFAWGPFGATMACCYLLLAFIAEYPFKRKEKWSRNAIIIAFGIWFIIDSGISLFYGVYFQFYAINMVSLMQKLLPIVFTWKDF